MVLATAADRSIAEAIAAPGLPFIGEVIASDGLRNFVKGKAKARALSERFPDGFIYA